MSFAFKNFQVALLPLIIIIFSYSNSLRNDFLLDDHIYFLQDGYHKFHETSAISLLTHGFDGSWRILGFLYDKLVFKLAGENPMGYYFFNIFLFYGLCLGVYFFSMSLLKNHFSAIIVACLYAAHPINNFLVNYKSAGYLNLYVLCMMLSTIFFLKYLDHKNKKLYILSLIFYAFSLFLHEVSFMLPIYLFLAVYFLRNNSWEKDWVWIIGFLPVLICYISLSLIEGRGESKLISVLFHPDFSWANYFATMISLIFWSVSKLIIPVNIIFQMDTEIVSGKVPWVIDTIFLLIFFILVYFILFKSRKGIIPFSLSLILLGYVPLWFAAFVQYPQFGTLACEPHWFYFSFLGFFILMTQGILTLKRVIGPRFGNIFIIFIVGTLIVCTRLGNKVWKDEATFCLYAIKLNPLNGGYWEGLWRGYLKQNKKNELIAVLQDRQRFLEEKANFLVYMFRGTIYGRIPEYNLALADFTNALKLKSDYRIYFDRGNVYNTIGQYNTAIDDYNETLKTNPGFAQGYNNRGFAHMMLGNLDLALKDFSKAIDIDPSSSLFYCNRAIIYNGQEKFDLAILDLNKAVSINPSNGFLYFNRSLSYRAKGETQEASNDIQMARSLGFVDGQ